MTTIAQPTARDAAPRVVIGGVDTHSQIHHAAALDDAGRLLATDTLPATGAGCRRLADWLMRHGIVASVGVECTGSYGARLARTLAERDVIVREVNQPSQHTRSRAGKDDRIDAIAAARAVLSGEATARAKNTTGPIEAIRYLHTTRDLLVKERTGLLNLSKDILITAPESVTRALPGATLKAKAVQAARLRPDSSSLTDPSQSAKLALRTVGKQIEVLNEHIRDLDQSLANLVAETAPTLTSCFAVSTHHAAQLLITAGQNIDRVTSKAASRGSAARPPFRHPRGRPHG